jgi:hypothetical protein
MNLSEFREKIALFLIPIIIVVIVLWGGIICIGNTYFWDVSRLTIEIPGNDPTQVRLDVQARVVYFDADLFGFYYPVHITIPFSQTETCVRECFFDRIPAGDATVTFMEKNVPNRTQIFIEPDTEWTLNLRPAFTTVSLERDAVEKLQVPALSSEERKGIPGSLQDINIVQGLLISQVNREKSLYDSTTKQLIPLPIAWTPIYVARGEIGGLYIFWTQDGITFWDRYGRTKTQIQTELIYERYTFSWPGLDKTRIVRSDGEITIPGIWSPLYGNTNLITDGKQIMRIE